MAEYMISPCFYPLSLMCWLERCFYKRLCVKLVMLSSLETKARPMWFKDWSDVTPSAFLTCFQTPPRELRWHQSAASERLLLCQLDLLFVRIDFIGPVSENIGIALLLFGPVVSALLNPSYITMWQTAHKNLLERAGRSCLWRNQFVSGPNCRQSQSQSSKRE